MSLKQTNENRSLPAGGMAKTRTILTDNPFINHGNKAAIMTAAQSHFFTSSGVSRQPKCLNSDEKKGRLGVQDSGSKIPLSVLFSHERRDGLVANGALYDPGYYSLLYLHMRFNGNQEFRRFSTLP